MNDNEKEEIRCFHCGRLWAKVDGFGLPEIKRHRCKKTNLYLLREKRNFEKNLYPFQ